MEAELGVGTSIRSYLDEHSRQLRRNWTEAMLARWANQRSDRILAFEDALSANTDALSFLYAALPGGEQQAHGIIIASIVDRVQSDSYTICDFFDEISTLKSHIQNHLESESPPGGQSWTFWKEIELHLDRGFREILTETSNLYENISERGGGALCLMDVNGMVTYTNRSAKKLMHSQEILGKHFEGFFREEDRPKIQHLMNSKKRRSTQISLQGNTENQPVHVNAGVNSGHGAGVKRGHLLMPDTVLPVVPAIHRRDPRCFV